MQNLIVINLRNISSIFVKPGGEFKLIKHKANLHMRLSSEIPHQFVESPVPLDYLMNQSG